MSLPLLEKKKIKNAVVSVFGKKEHSNLSLSYLLVCSFDRKPDPFLMVITIRYSAIYKVSEGNRLTEMLCRET